MLANCAWTLCWQALPRATPTALLLLDHTMLDHATTTFYSLEHDPKRSHQTKNRHIRLGYVMPVRTHDSGTQIVVVATAPANHV